MFIRPYGVSCSLDYTANRGINSIDIDLALQLGCTTKLGRSFKAPDAVIPGFSDLVFKFHSPLANAIRYTDPKVFTAAQDIIKVCYLFNSRVVAKKLGAYTFQNIITSTCYLLLEIRPVNSSYYNMHPIADTICLALLSFMTTFFIQIGGQRHLRYELLSYRLIEALDNSKFQAAIDPATHLWLLVIAGISVLDKDDYVWLKPRLTKAVEHFGRTDWGFTRRLLGEYPWVSNLHDELTSQLWETFFPSTINGQKS